MCASAGPQRGLCPCSLLILAANVGPSLWAAPAPGTPAGRGQSLVQCRHFGVPGAGSGATQLSSSLQRQEEDGHGSPELWAGLVGHSTARHHHHCDRREGDSQAPVSLEDQGIAGREAAVGGPISFSPLSGDLKRTMPSKHTDTSART